MGRRWQRPLHDSRPPSGTAVLERAALEGCGKRHFRPGGHDIYVDDKGNVSAADRILPETLPANPNPVLKEFFDYYRMPRGFHARSVNSTGAWNATMPLSFMNMPLLSYASEVTIPTLIVTGEQAHSRYFAEDAFKAIGSKEKALVIVPGANHVDLYDNVAGKIPFATFTQFFKTNLQ
ncbi:membrane protein [Klebsiella aerogenes]|nr:membrane protein [Klebsiella aerogenes]